MADGAVLCNRAMRIFGFLTAAVFLLAANRRAKVPEKQRNRYHPSRQRELSISIHYPPFLALTPPLRWSFGLLLVSPSPNPSRITDANFRCSRQSSPTGYTFALPSSSGHRVQAPIRLDQDHLVPAYPSTNGNAGGKLPRGNITSRNSCRALWE